VRGYGQRPFANSCARKSSLGAEFILLNVKTEERIVLLAKQAILASVAGAIADQVGERLVDHQESGRVLAREDLLGFDLQDCDYRRRRDIGLVFGAFAGAEHAGGVAVRQLVDACLGVGIGAQFHNPPRSFGCQATAHRLKNPLKDVLEA
jgi:hypothetical protein